MFESDFKNECKKAFCITLESHDLNFSKKKRFYSYDATLNMFESDFKNEYKKAFCITPKSHDLNFSKKKRCGFYTMRLLLVFWFIKETLSRNQEDRKCQRTWMKK